MYGMELALLVAVSGAADNYDVPGLRVEIESLFQSLVKGGNNLEDFLSAIDAMFSTIVSLPKLRLEVAEAYMKNLDELLMHVPFRDLLRTNALLASSLVIALQPFA